MPRRIPPPDVADRRAAAVPPTLAELNQEPGRYFTLLKRKILRSPSGQTIEEIPSGGIVQVLGGARRDLRTWIQVRSSVSMQEGEINTKNSLRPTSQAEMRRRPTAHVEPAFAGDGSQETPFVIPDQQLAMGSIPGTLAPYRPLSDVQIVAPIQLFANQDEDAEPIAMLEPGDWVRLTTELSTNGTRIKVVSIPAQPLETCYVGYVQAGVLQPTYHAERLEPLDPTSQIGPRITQGELNDGWLIASMNAAMVKGWRPEHHLRVDPSAPNRTIVRVFQGHSWIDISVENTIFRSAATRFGALQSQAFMIEKAVAAATPQIGDLGDFGLGLRMIMGDYPHSQQQVTLSIAPRDLLGLTASPAPPLSAADLQQKRAIIFAFHQGLGMVASTTRDEAAFLASQGLAAGQHYAVENCDDRHIWLDNPKGRPCRHLGVPYPDQRVSTLTWSEFFQVFRQVSAQVANSHDWFRFAQISLGIADEQGVEAIEAPSRTRSSSASSTDGYAVPDGSHSSGSMSRSNTPLFGDPDHGAPDSD